MTPDEIRPAIGQSYRHRRSGKVAVLMRYKPTDYSYRQIHPLNPGLVRLKADDGWEWSGCQSDFWEEFLHADAGRKKG
jgi:hypothetical protein